MEKENCLKCSEYSANICDICLDAVCNDCIYDIQEILDIFGKNLDRNVWGEAKKFCFKCSWQNLDLIID